MKITLMTTPDEHVYRNIKAIFYPLPSLGLLYIAAVLKKDNFDVSLIDMQFHTIEEDHVVESIARSDLIGLTGMTPSIGLTYDTARRIKRLFPGKKIAVGGAHATALPEEVAANEFVDFVIVGEGEETFLELVRKLNSGSFSSIDGLVYKKQGKIIRNKSRDMIRDLDALPFPAYDLIDIKKYAYAIQRKHPLATILTSRGCPGHCIYCNKGIFGHKFRYRSVENVLGEMEMLNKKYGVREIHIMDDAFSTDIERAKQICKALIKRNLNIVWGCPTGIRVDAIDRELLFLMKKAGCYFVAFGIESGDNRILKSIGKGTTVEMNRRAVKMAQEAGLETFLFYIIGAPYDTEETIQNTIRFAKRIRGAYSKFSILTPYPGTPLYSFLERKDRLVKKNWNDLIIQGEIAYKPFYLTRDEVKRYWREAYRKVIFSPAYVLGKIKLKYFFNFTYFRRLVSVAAGLFLTMVLRAGKRR